MRCLGLLQLSSCLPAGFSDTDSALSSIGVLPTTATNLKGQREQVSLIRGARDLLLQKALVNKLGDRLIMLSPIRLYIQQMEFDRGHLNIYFINFVDKRVYDMPKTEAAQLRVEVPNLCASIRHAIESMSVTASEDDLRSLRSQLCDTRSALVALDFYAETAHINEMALAYFKAVKDRLGQAQCMQSLGWVARMQNDYEKAQALYEGAKALFVQVSDRLGQAQCMRSLGDIARMQNNNEAAQLLLESTKTLFEQIAHRRGQAQCMQSLGDIACMQQEYEKAQALLESAKMVFEQINDRLGQTKILRLLSELQLLKTGLRSPRR